MLLYQIVFNMILLLFMYFKNVLEFLTDKFNCCPHKIIHFSDGAAAQYKNQKIFLNLCHQKADFAVDAEWHFFATSHGKGPCDNL